MHQFFISPSFPKSSSSPSPKSSSTSNPSTAQYPPSHSQSTHNEEEEDNEEENEEEEEGIFKGESEGEALISTGNGSGGGGSGGGGEGGRELDKIGDDLPSSSSMMKLNGDMMKVGGGGGEGGGREGEGVVEIKNGTILQPWAHRDIKPVRIYVLSSFSFFPLPSRLFFSFLSFFPPIYLSTLSSSDCILLSSFRSIFSASLSLLLLLLLLALILCRLRSCAVFLSIPLPLPFFLPSSSVIFFNHFSFNHIFNSLILSSSSSLSFTSPRTSLQSFLLIFRS